MFSAWEIEKFSNYRLTLKSSFTAFFLFVSSANDRKDENSNPLVAFCQTIRLPSFRITNCSCSFSLMKGNMGFINKGSYGIVFA